MDPLIRHRRLYAFYNSKVLNILLIIGEISLLQIGYMQPAIIPGVCAAISLMLFLGYIIWFWLKKPKKIIIDTWISDMSSWFTIYYLIVINIDNGSWWWCGAPMIAAILLCFINMVNPHDQPFEI